MSERHQRSSPYVPHYAPVLTPSFSFKGSLENVRNAFGTWGKSVGEASKKAVDIAGNSWHHLKTSPRFADAAVGRISRAIKVLTKGGCERIFRSTFEMVPEEHLRHSFACYLSSSSGPVMGVLYLSTAKIAYCSDNLVLHKFENQTESGYYQVVIPLHQLRAVIPWLSKSHPGEKYLQIISTDGHEVWFMGFLNYNGAVQCLQEALHVQSISMTMG